MGCSSSAPKSEAYALSRARTSSRPTKAVRPLPPTPPPAEEAIFEGVVADVADSDLATPYAAVLADSNDFSLPPPVDPCFSVGPVLRRPSVTSTAKASTEKLCITTPIESTLEALVSGRPVTVQLQRGKADEPEWDRTQKGWVRWPAFGLSTNGKTVVSVCPNGVAEKAGVVVGMKFLEVDSIIVKYDSELYQALKTSVSPTCVLAKPESSGRACPKLGVRRNSRSAPIVYLDGTFVRTDSGRDIPPLVLG